MERKSEKIESKTYNIKQKEARQNKRCSGNAQASLPKTHAFLSVLINI